MAIELYQIMVISPRNTGSSYLSHLQTAVLDYLVLF